MKSTELTIGRLLERVRAGQDAGLEMPPAAAADLLDGLAAALEGDCRIVRVVAPASGLGMSGFMAQVSGGSDVTAQDDAVLEVGYRMLATPERPGGRIALLISGSDRLRRPVLRFIQHVARGAGSLVLVMAGAEGWLAALDPADFATLRSRLGAPATPASEPAAAPTAPPVPAVLPAAEAAAIAIAAPVRPGRRTAVPTWLFGAPGWTIAGVGMLASVAFGVWLGQRPLRFAPSRPAVVTPASTTPAPQRPHPLVPTQLAALPLPVAETPAASPASRAPVPAPAPQQAQTPVSTPTPAPASAVAEPSAAAQPPTAAQLSTTAQPSTSAQLSAGGQPSAAAQLPASVQPSAMAPPAPAAASVEPATAGSAQPAPSLPPPEATASAETAPPLPAASASQPPVPSPLPALGLPALRSPDPAAVAANSPELRRTSEPAVADASPRHRRALRRADRLRDEVRRVWSTRLAARHQLQDYTTNTSAMRGAPQEADPTAEWQRPAYIPYARSPYLGTFMADEYGRRRFRPGDDLGD